MLIQDLGHLDYRTAWKLQEQVHAQVLEGHEERLLLLEHPPVITLGRRPGVSGHLVASEEQLRRRGVEVIETDRGGDITFHGPGQLVAYPIVRLADHRLSVSGYVHTLEKLVIQTLSDFGIMAHADPSAVGVWVANSDQTTSAKIAAIGVRIRRGVSLHGLALNVNTELSFFDLIVACGLANRTVTSLHQLLGPSAPSMIVVKAALARHFCSAF